jgi:tripartite-type tricarboxylate transporter receptor subunit TctC
MKTTTVLFARLAPAKRARRIALLAATIALLSVVAAKSANAQTASTGAGQAWPNKPLKIIVPFTPGGTTDNLARILAQKLSEAYKQNVLVENRPGAAGVIGSDAVAKAAPDGYTLLLSSLASQVIAPVVQKTPYDGLRDFTHIAILGGPPTALSVGPALPDIKDLKSFIALAKSKPGSIAYGTPGNGTHGHMIAELFKQLSGAQITHVPYKGSGPAVADLVAGHVPAGSLTIAIQSPQLRAGKIRALASTSAKRLPDFPDVPTFAELGYPALTAITWFGIAGPPKMPEAVTESLNREIRKAMQSADVRERLQSEAFEIPDLNVAQTTEYVRNETARWQPIARASSAKND